MSILADVPHAIEGTLDPVADGARGYPFAGSAQEREQFVALQSRLTPLVAHVFPDRHAARASGAVRGADRASRARHGSMS